ncbi:MAG: thioredoxin family protein [bacterium]|nr:thioredoxin family protein [bacterium]
MKIQILGTGCLKCNQLEKNARDAISQLGLDCEIEKISDINEIIGFGVMMTPGFVVDGNVKSSGKLLSVAEIKELLQ